MSNAEYGLSEENNTWNRKAVKTRMLKDEFPTRWIEICRVCKREILECWCDDVLAFIAGAEEKKPEHVCGLQGFGRGIDGENDHCPACEVRGKEQR